MDNTKHFSRRIGYDTRERVMCPADRAAQHKGGAWLLQVAKIWARQYKPSSGVRVERNVN
ncbi:MAG: hypothetical protein HQL18_02515 [Candidatus Omnitrophica bacterium]|nr:hypothetical protein [Candidatus Omnitrophota bacterium]